MDAQSTVELLNLAQRGDQSARDALFSKAASQLKRWASGRLPHYARDIADTQDLVQVTLMRAWNRLDHFRSQGSGSFMAYLRQILLNRIKEELRRAGRSPDTTEKLEIRDRDGGLSANLGQLETLERYESALQKLPNRSRDAIILRLEFGMAYGEIADELDAPSPDAARMIVARGLKSLAEGMTTVG